MAIRAVRQRVVRHSHYQIFQAAFPDFIRHIHSLRRLRDREFRKLTAMPGRDRHSRTRKLLNSPSLHLLYAFEAVRKAKRLRNATPESISALAARCNPFERCEEPGKPLWVPARGRNRLVMSYSPAKRMNQLLVADLLVHLHPPLEQQYLFRGGMPAAFSAVEAAYAEGFTYGVEIDFVDFYGSVGFDGLAELLRPLPPSVVQHVVWDRALGTADDDDIVSISASHPYPPSSASRGLSLGSACSPVVGERILARLISSTDTCRMVAYADNILVLGRTPEAVTASFREMQQRASGFVGGALEPRMDGEGVRSLAQQHFQFLHHEVSLEDGQFIWSPDQRKRRDFLTAEVDGHLEMQMIARTEAQVGHWRRAYPNWPDGDLWEIQQLAALAARRYYNDATPINRSKAANALIASFYAGGRLQAIDELPPTGNAARDDARRAELIEAAQRRLIIMARRARLGLDAIRPIG